MRAWPAPDVPALPAPAPAVALHDTVDGRPGHDHAPTARPGCTSAASRRTTPPTSATRRRTSASTCSTGPGATPATTSSTSRTSPTSTTRCSSAPPRSDVDWVELAERETELFRQDMTALRVLPPDALRRRGRVDPARGRPDRAAAGGRRRLPGRGRPLLLGRPPTRRSARSPDCRRERDAARSSPSAAATPTGRARRTRSTASSGAASARASRPGTARSGPAGPAGTSSARRSRSSTSASTFDVQGGGSDLVFPHHEMCAGHAQVADRPSRSRRSTPRRDGRPTTARRCRSPRGNLVFVSQLRNSDVDPMAIRLALLRHHYRTDWEWLDAELWDAVDTSPSWRRAFALRAGAPAAPVVTEVLAALADDLDAPARAAPPSTRWVDATLGTTAWPTPATPTRPTRSRRCSTPPSGSRLTRPAGRAGRVPSRDLARGRRAGHRVS